MLIRYHFCTKLTIYIKTSNPHHFTNTLLKHNWCNVIHYIKSDMKLTLRRKLPTADINSYVCSCQCKNMFNIKTRLVDSACM